MDSRPIIDTALVRRLVATQFPQWKDLAVRPIELGGWGNRTFQLGDEMTVRLPLPPPGTGHRSGSMAMSAGATCLSKRIV
jgi:aminoglycoside phosphotransferase (APT) family kinase protein